MKEESPFRIIEQHLVIDPDGKVRIQQDLMDALKVKEGDMLSFYFDRETDTVTVKGQKKPPHFHAENTVRIPSLKPNVPVEPTKVVPTPLASKPKVTQATMFEGGSQPVGRQKRK